MKLVDRFATSCLDFSPASTARALAPVLFLFFASHVRAAVDTFQEGISGYSGTHDTFLEQNTPDTSHDESLVKVENDPPQVQHGLIRFDNIFGGGAGQSPFGSIINSATLTVEVDNQSAAGAQIRLHRMLVTWPESATWNSMICDSQSANWKRCSSPRGVMLLT